MSAIKRHIENLAEAIDKNDIETAAELLAGWDLEGKQMLLKEAKAFLALVKPERTEAIN